MALKFPPSTFELSWLSDESILGKAKNTRAYHFSASPCDTNSRFAPSGVYKTAPKQLSAFAPQDSDVCHVSIGVADKHQKKSNTMQSPTAPLKPEGVPKLSTKPRYQIPDQENRWGCMVNAI
jgi:hypothetical protein